jgi:rare lipoprotein A
MAENRKNQAAPVQVALVPTPVPAPSAPLVETMPVVAPVTQVTALGPPTAEASAELDAMFVKDQNVDRQPLPVTAPAPVIRDSVASQPAVPVPTVPVPTVTATPNSASGIYLQFGAFGLKSNAEATFTHLQTQLTQLPAFEIVQQGTLYRLFSGPFANRDAANDAIALAIRSGLPKPIIVQR